MKGKLEKFGILRGLKHITSAWPSLRIGHELCDESKRTEFCKKEKANLSSQLTLCSFSCYAVRKWSITSLSKLNTNHSATSKQNHIQVTSWLASDKILSSIIIKWIHFTTVVWHVVFLVRHCTAIHDQFTHGIVQQNLYNHSHMRQFDCNKPSKSWLKRRTLYTKTLFGNLSQRCGATQDRLNNCNSKKAQKGRKGSMSCEKMLSCFEGTTTRTKKWFISY